MSIASDKKPRRARTEAPKPKRSSSRRRVHSFGLQIADLFASGPTRSKILRLAPSRQLFERVRLLKMKARKSRLSLEEQWELKQFRFERELMLLVKGIIRDGDAIQ